jgi:hypothetical protein
MERFGAPLPGGTFTGVQKELKAAGLTFYPNPAGSELNIVTDPSGYDTVSVFDVLGKKVATFALQQGVSVISTVGLEKGLYIFRFSGPAGEYTGRIVTGR